MFYDIAAVVVMGVLALLARRLLAPPDGRPAPGSSKISSSRVCARITAVGRAVGPGRGAPLPGENAYVLHADADAMPPADAF